MFGIKQTPWPALLLIIVWSWAIWSCAEFWMANPNYSYGWAVPLLALGFAVRRYLWLDSVRPRGDFRISKATTIFVALACVALVLFLEFSREQASHPIVVVWAISGLAVTSTIALFWLRGGFQLARAEIFPVCFFLTAVPWPPRFEQPITTTLMRWVAVLTTELLHWFGIEATVSGGAIALSSGLVGITEACSGIRSLQAGIMFGLAMGEWFLLSATRRIVLLFIAIALALATNLARTLALTLQAQWHGIDSVDRVHDLIGNIIITSLVLIIWLVGKLLAPKEKSPPAIARSTSIFRRAQPIFAFVSIALLIGLISARAWSARIESTDAAQTSPFFVAKMDNSPRTHLDKIPKNVWNELHPTSGEYVRHESDRPNERIDCFHFFWKPSPWNRFALVHRPDVCMPGIGWQLDGEAQAQDVDLGGRSLRFYLFRFHRGDVNAIELWGAWRNGESVTIDYRPDQILGTVAPPASLQVNGKRRSATEIVSCSVVMRDREPAAEEAMEILRSVFEYKPR